MSVKIVSDGTAHGTKVFAVDADGREVEVLGVLGVSWAVSVQDKKATALVVFDHAQIEGTADDVITENRVPPHSEGTAEPWVGASIEAVRENMGSPALRVETIYTSGKPPQLSDRFKGYEAAPLPRVSVLAGALSDEDVNEIRRNTTTVLEPIASHRCVFCDVQDFMDSAEQEIQETPGEPDGPTRDLRMRLVDEEIAELYTAWSVGNLPEIADGIADAMYVLIGMAHAYGIPIDEVWAEVQRSNMAKFGQGLVRRDDGKLMKPPGWTPPSVASILRKHGWKG